MTASEFDLCEVAHGYWVWQVEERLGFHLSTYPSWLLYMSAVQKKNIAFPEHGGQVPEVMLYNAEI